MKLVMVVLLSAFASTAALAANQAGPCEQIKQACESAGFVKGQAKAGTGLWVDCIDPIIQGKAQPTKAAKPLPTVDAATVAACKAKRPNFGEQKAK